MMHLTPCKISTITATGGVNSLINLHVFYDNVDIDVVDVKPNSVVYIECSKDKNGNTCRGKNLMQKTVSKKKKESKCFDNQVTCIVTLNGINFVNVKVFKNGKIQMTGLKQIDQGRGVIDCIIEHLKTIYNRGQQNVVDAYNNLMNVDYKVQLINSDFKVGMEIRRDRLNKIVQGEYNILSSFEPCIYPGVKIQYFWNKQRIGHHDGICTCDGFCDGRGNSDCKKITIAVFQSGCIIITGAQTLVQIEDAYNFICRVIEDHMSDIQKKNVFKELL